jgi:LysR family hca operon transcriptional activator
VGLAPAYVEKLLPAALVTRPLEGEVPTIDLVVGYLGTNRSPSLKAFLSKLETLVAGVSNS